MIKRWFGIGSARRKEADATLAAILSLADKARAAKDWNAAARAFEMYLAEQPQDAAIHEQRAHALKEAGNLAAAADAYRTALECEPDQYETRLHLAHCLKNKGDLDEAAAEFMLLMDSRRFAAEAEDQFSKVIPGLFAERADKYRERRDWNAAAENYAASLRLAPKQGSIWLQLGHALKEAKRLKEAAEAYRNASMSAPKDPEPWLHLAHVLRSTGPREESVRALARTWVLGNRNAGVSDALKNAAGYRPEEVRTAIESEAREAGLPPTSYADDLDKIAAASLAHSAAGFEGKPGRPIIYLSGIDWGYRRQRPQHMAVALASSGCKVFFVSTVFDQSNTTPGFAISRHLAENVAEVRLTVDTAGAGSLHFGLSNEACVAAGRAITALCDAAGENPVIVIDHPAWFRICETARSRALTVYDCIDNIRAFPGAPAEIVAAEDRLIEGADAIVTSAQVLADSMSARRRVKFVPNGAETDRFGRIALAAPPKGKVRILYFGMIAEWFDWTWIEHTAKAHPDWTFQMVGEAVPAVAEKLRQIANVEMVGEVAYERLPDFLAGASATIIPFRLSELTHAVNPVKAYEYLSAGRPVVASAMRELKHIPFIRTANTASEFEAILAESIAKDTPELRQARSQWALAHDWKERAQRLMNAIDFSPASSANHNLESQIMPAALGEGEERLPFGDFVLFVAPFPKPGTVVEGWMGRIRAVDEIFLDAPRIYLHFTTGADPDLPPKRIQHTSEAWEVFIHPASPIHARFVERAMAACRFCYVQTVHLAKYVAGFYPTGKLITDFHGIVPEEEEMLGNPEAGKFYEGIECTVVHCSRHIVVVTKSMANHLRHKYPSANFEEIVLPIIVDYEPPSQDVSRGAPDKPTVIYSGGSQVWQNIDLMLGLIAQSKLPATYRIASHDQTLIKNKAQPLGVADQIEFGVYKREQLPDFYASADFGFVLRDDSPVNRVACPTKLTEYLQFGVIPIVKLAEIGDFATEGYEYLTGEEFAAGFVPGQKQRSEMIERNRAVLGRFRAQFADSAQRLKVMRLASRIPCGELSGLPTSSLLGVLPWKREAYVFGQKMTYLNATFLRPYAAAAFDMPDGAEGDLIRVVPMVGDFVAELEEVTISIQGDPATKPIVAQSHARVTPAGDLFSEKAPFLDIKLSHTAKINRVEYALRFVRTTPLMSSLVSASSPRSGGVPVLRVRIKAGEAMASYDMPLSYVG